MTTSPVALCFDVFGTVVDWRSGVAAEAERLLAPFGAVPDWAGFADAWRARYQPAMQAVRAGERPFVPLDTLHRENLDQLLEERGFGAVPEAVRAELTLAWHRLDPWPDSVAGLTRLRRRFILAPLSNGNVRLIVDMAKRAGLPWDLVLGAEIAGAYKPLPRAYRRAAELLALPPFRCMMVAAHNNDLAAAREQGFRTAFVCRPAEYGPDQRTDLGAESDWDFAVRSLSELADALGC